MLPLAVPALVTAQQREFYAAPFYYQTNADGSVTLTGYDGPGGSVVLPSSISNLPVTALYTTFAALPFRPNTTLTEVIIPSGVVSIDYGVFYYCTALTNVVIPPSLTSIGEEAFYATGLTTISVATNVTSIGAAAFSDCRALTNAMIYGISTLPQDAFDYCTTLQSVTLPATITEIDGDPFGSCPSLTGVFFMGNGPILLTAEPGAGFVFKDNPNTTVYYLPGTSNWTWLAQFTGVTTALWNPLIQTANGSFGVRNNQFGFDITGTTNIPIVVQASTNPANPVWTSLTNVTLTNGLFHFSEPAQTNTPARYYRIASP